MLVPLPTSPGRSRNPAAIQKITPYSRYVRKKPPPVILDEKAVNIFTDGSSLPAPRRGGVGIVIVVVDADGHEVVYDGGPVLGRPGGTNQEMELLACVEALRLVGGRHSPVDVRPFTKVVIHTDSMYVTENYPRAKFTWSTNGWYTKDGNPVLHAELWKDLLKTSAKIGKRVDIEWHQGHSATNPHNKAADKLAKASAKVPLGKPVKVSGVRRKRTANTTEAGSIRPEGQRLVLRVVTDSFLRPQKMYVYKCEVVSPDSPYFEKVDNLYSTILLKAGHTYDVRLNDEPKRPRIEELYGEVDTPPLGGDASASDSDSGAT